MARSSGSAWIEPKHGTPCRVCWRRNGKKQKPSKWFPKRADALSLRNALNRRLSIERPLIPSGQLLPLADVRDRWLAARQAAGAMSKGTAHEAKREITRLLALTKWKTVADVTASEVQGFRTEHPKNAKGATMRYLRAMLRWSALGHTLAQPVAQGLDLSTPQTQPAHRPLATDEQVLALVAATRAEGTWPLIHVASTYPWRPKSLSLLRVRDVDLSDPEAASVFLRKTKSGRDVRGPLMPISAAILAPLVADRPPGAFVFLRPDGTPWPLDKKESAHAMSRWFTKTLGKCGLQLYDLKRKGMTELGLVAEGDIAAVAEIAGVSKQTALRYMQTNQERIRALLKRRAASGAIRGQFGQSL